MLRTIKTARNLKDINESVGEGLFPLIKEIKPSRLLYETYYVFRNRKTNEVVMAPSPSGYYQYNRSYDYLTDEWEMIICGAQHYPYHYECPFAAYLIPADITVGERVLIVDLIEDYYGGQFWSSKIRLEMLEAVWNGQDLIVQYDEKVDGVCTWVG